MAIRGTMSTMRINKFIANSSELSRRAADRVIEQGRITVNGIVATAGTQVESSDVVLFDGKILRPDNQTLTILFHKPVGYVCSKNGQGSETIYDILPEKFRHLNPVGRLDKDSSGLLLLTNDGQLAQQLTHPSYQKTKIYEITLDRPLQPLHQQMISDFGVSLDDGKSQFLITKLGSPDRFSNAHSPSHKNLLESLTNRRLMTGEPIVDNRNNLNYAVYQVTMHEGRNRQIRRTFASLGYTVTSLHRTNFGMYALQNLSVGQTKQI